MTGLVNYYVTNPTDNSVIVGGTIVGPWMREPVLISRDEAVDLKSSGWTVVLRAADQEAGLIPVDVTAPDTGLRTIVDIVADGGNNDYNLSLADLGKVLSGTAMGIKILPDAICTFPIGGTCTIISTDAEIDIQADPYTDDDDTDFDAPVVYSSGTSTASIDWRIPARTVATLIKTAANEYMLVGTGITDNVV